MHTTDVPLAPEERLREVAALLAAGFLRLKRRTGCVPAEVNGLNGRWRPCRTASSPKRSSSVSAPSRLGISSGRHLLFIEFLRVEAAQRPGYSSSSSSFACCLSGSFFWPAPPACLPSQ